MYSPLVPGGFVQHVAILRSDRDLSFNEPNVEVWHMQPPLLVGHASAAAANMDAVCPVVHVVGAIDLDADDCESIKTWLAIVETEKRPYGRIGNLRQYVVKPHVDWERAKETNQPLYRKFSCAGFVVECYREAVGIDLVSLPEITSPEVDLTMVLGAYPDADRESLRERFGIRGTGPWKILLAGYLFHSLKRTPDALIRSGPHLPSNITEAYFP